MEGLRREVSELRCDVGYWKSMHADAVARNERLTAELDEARGEIRVLQDKLFGRKSEKSRSGDRSNDLVDPEQAADRDEEAWCAAGPRGTRSARLFPFAGSRGIRSVAGRIAGLPALRKAGGDDVGHRGFGIAGDRSASRTGGGFDGDGIGRHAIAIRRGERLTAPPPPKLIPKGNYGISIWVHVLLDKYSSYRPTERLLGQLEQYGLDLPAGTVNDGLQPHRAHDEADLRGALPAESAGRIPSGGRNALAGFYAFGREKRPWLVAVGHSRRGHGGLSARSQPQSSTCRKPISVPRHPEPWKSIAIPAIKPWRK